MSEVVRVMLPDELVCPGCCQVVNPPYRGKPLDLAGRELLVWCSADCWAANGVEGRLS